MEYFKLKTVKKIVDKHVKELRTNRYFPSVVTLLSVYRTFEYNLGRGSSLLE